MYWRHHSSNAVREALQERSNWICEIGKHNSKVLLGVHDSCSHYKQPIQMKMRKERVIAVCGELGRKKLFLSGVFCVVAVNIARLYSCYCSQHQ